jgi:hypothetical protein
MSRLHATRLSRKREVVYRNLVSFIWFEFGNGFAPFLAKIVPVGLMSLQTITFKDDNNLIGQSVWHYRVVIVQFVLYHMAHYRSGKSDLDECERALVAFLNSKNRYQESTVQVARAKAIGAARKDDVWQAKQAQKMLQIIEEAYNDPRGFIMSMRMKNISDFFPSDDASPDFVFFECRVLSAMTMSMTDEALLMDATGGVGHDAVVVDDVRDEKVSQKKQLSAIPVDAEEDEKAEHDRPENESDFESEYEGDSADDDDDDGYDSRSADDDEDEGGFEDDEEEDEKSDDEEAQSEDESPDDEPMSDESDYASDRAEANYRKQAPKIFVRKGAAKKVDADVKKDEAVVTPAPGGGRSVGLSGVTLYGEGPRVDRYGSVPERDFAQCGSSQGEETPRPEVDLASVVSLDGEPAEPVGVAGVPLDLTKIDVRAPENGGKSQDSPRRGSPQFVPERRRFAPQTPSTDDDSSD